MGSGSKIMGVLGGLAILAIGAASVWYFVLQSPYRRALPRGATEVNETTISATGTTIVYLKARFPSDLFAGYCREMKLTPLEYEKIRGEAMVYAKWESERPLGWWRPSANLVGAYWRQDDDVLVMAKHEDGFLYVKVVKP